MEEDLINEIILLEGKLIELLDKENKQTLREIKLRDKESELDERERKIREYKDFLKEDEDYMPFLKELKEALSPLEKIGLVAGSEVIPVYEQILVSINEVEDNYPRFIENHIIIKAKEYCLEQIKLREGSESTIIEIDTIEST